jgi:hypothetical protein
MHFPQHSKHARLLTTTTDLASTIRCSRSATDIALSSTWIKHFEGLFWFVRRDCSPRKLELRLEATQEHTNENTCAASVGDNANPTNWIVNAPVEPSVTGQFALDCELDCAGGPLS